MILTRGQKAAATRKRNYGKAASREQINKILKTLPHVTEDELMADFRFYQYLVAYRDMVARKAAAAVNECEIKGGMEEDRKQTGQSADLESLSCVQNEAMAQAPEISMEIG
jgi:hypothetical protein